MDDKNKEKDNILFTWILEHSSCLLTAIFLVAVVGLLYSIVYELWGYNIDFLPDVGTPADFCGVLGTMLAIFVTWQQIRKSDDKARKDKKEAREKLQASQEQFNKTIKEMQREREEAYKPDLYMDTEEKTFSISESSDDIEITSGDKDFRIINVGAGTAKNIVIEAYSEENLDNLKEYAKGSILPVDDNTIMYSLIHVGNFEDKIKSLNDGYLFPTKDQRIDVPEIYRRILRDRIFELAHKNEINGDPFTDLPEFTYNITYQDQEEIEYSKKVVIYAKCWDIKSDKCKVTLLVENKPARKV